MKWCRTFVIVAVLLMPVMAHGQEPDSTDTPPPLPAPEDSAQTLIPPDSADNVPIETDSLADVDSLDLSFEERYKKFRKDNIERPASLTAFDSLVTYFASERFNMRDETDRSSFTDAGDYFRFDPSFAVMNWNQTPLRKTVQPFGLAGNRLNLVINRMSVSPFEHIVEPDGLVDLNDVPTALDDDVYVMSGPVGMLFGGRQTLATLVSLPGRPGDSDPHTAIYGDQGSFSYSWVRGRYSRRFPGGREIDASIGYRESEGDPPALGDDVYHYTGNVYLPIGRSLGVRGQGQLYSRDGWIPARYDATFATVSRDRFDRDASLSFDWQDSARTRRLEAGYRYLRQGSFLEGRYSDKFSYTGHGGFLKTEFLAGSLLASVEARGEHLEYTNYGGEYLSDVADVNLRLARLSRGWRFALAAGGRYDPDFSFMPSGVAVIMRETGGSLFMISAGYAEREPSLHERFLPEHRTALYQSVNDDYVDRGNPDLETEKQMTAQLIYELGSPERNLRLAVTGGTIKDGIDWTFNLERDTVGTDTLELNVYSPANGDIDFYDISGQIRYKLHDFATFLGGGAYHSVEFDSITNPSYTPEYQFFSGLQLHYFWRQKQVDLYAYGELNYMGPYEGYKQLNLGDKVVANAKLTLAMHHFDFHFVFQNVMATTYFEREYMLKPGRTYYYGISWRFDD